MSLADRLKIARNGRTYTLDEAVKLLKEGHIIRHKRFAPGANIYLDARGKIMCPLWSRPSKMGIEAYVSMFADSEDGWIDLGFRYGIAREALQWMKDGGVVRRRGDGWPERACFFVPEGSDKIRYRFRDGRDCSWGNREQWLEIWARELFALLPPLGEEKSKLEPKDGATFEEAQRWLDMGGRVRRYPEDKTCWYYKKNGEIMFNYGGEFGLNDAVPGGNSFVDSGIFRSLWTLIPMDKPADKKPGEVFGGARKEGKTRAMAEKVVEHLEKGGAVALDALAGSITYRLVDGKLRVNNGRSAERVSAYPDLEAFTTQYPGNRYELLPIPEPAPKRLTAEGIVKHLEDGGIVRFRFFDYRLHEDELQLRYNNTADVFEPSRTFNAVANFASSAAADPRFVLLPKPPTRLEVTEHLRKGGKVQWRDGKPGVWTAFAGVLLWTPKGSTKALFSHHNCNGHWFGDFTDDEISYLELLPIEKPKTATKAAQEQVNSWERALLDWLRVPASSCPGRRTPH